MKKATNNLFSFEEFKLENLKFIIGGNNGNNMLEDEPIDPTKIPPGGGRRDNDRPDS